MAELNTREKEIIQSVLNRWGAWEFSGLDDKPRRNMIAILMIKAGGEQALAKREMCCDEAGLLISSVIGYCVKKPCPEDYKYLEAHYVYGCSVYAIAKWQWKKDKSVTERHWRRRIAESIAASEWMVSKMLNLAVKRCKSADKMQKLVFGLDFMS